MPPRSKTPKQPPADKRYPVLATKLMGVDSLSSDPRNAKVHADRDIEVVMHSLQKYGQRKPIVVTANGIVKAGNGTLEAARRLGWKQIATAPAPKKDADARGYALIDNRSAELSNWNQTLLGSELSDLAAANYDISLLGWDESDLSALLAAPPEAEPEAARTPLTDQFLIPPFTILDARQGYWKDRKCYWLDAGIASAEGRGENLLKMSNRAMNLRGIKQGDEKWGGTSVFDPVLCEIAYRWFGLPGGTVLDPFAGGSVRGIVAGALGMSYQGVDISQRQIAENQKQAKKVAQKFKGWKQPKWSHGNSAQIEEIVDTGFAADLVFSCPPYFDLEKYSDDPEDMSNLPWPEFQKQYAAAIQGSARMLENDRFAVWVISNVRDKQGFYRNLRQETVAAFESEGCRLYNEAILITAVGSLAMRAGKIFRGLRKLARAHQEVLCFLKGNPAKMQKALGKIEGVVDAEP